MNSLINNEDAPEITKVDLEAIKARLKELSSFTTEDDKTDVKVNFFQLQILKGIQKLMKEKGLKKKDLAESLQVSKSLITQIFSADKPLSLKYIILFGDLVDAVPEISLISKSEAKRRFKRNIFYEQSIKEGIIQESSTDSYFNYNIKPNFNKMRVSYRNPNDKNLQESTLKLKVG